MKSSLWLPFLSNKGNMINYAKKCCNRPRSPLHWKNCRTHDTLTRTFLSGLDVFTFRTSCGCVQPMCSTVTDLKHVHIHVLICSRCVVFCRPMCSKFLMHHNHDNVFCKCSMTRPTLVFCSVGLHQGFPT